MPVETETNVRRSGRTRKQTQPFAYTEPVKKPRVVKRKKPEPEVIDLIKDTPETIPDQPSSPASSKSSLEEINQTLESVKITPEKPPKVYTAKDFKYQPKEGSKPAALLFGLNDLFDRGFCTPSDAGNFAAQYTEKPVRGADSYSALPTLKSKNLVVENSLGAIKLTEKGRALCKFLEEKGKKPRKMRELTKPRKYTPKHRSGSYGILMALYEKYPTTLSKSTICSIGQRYCDASFTSGGRFNAWDSIGTLTSKLLVDDLVDNTFSLSDAGYEVAKQLHKKFEENADTAAMPAEEDEQRRAVERRNYVAPRQRNDYNFDRFMDNHYFTNHGVYEKDAKDPAIVTASRNGDKQKVENLLQRWKNSTLLHDKINEAKIYHEVQEKWGYDKEWHWWDDTALHAAIRNNREEIVYLLLKHQADPTLKSGHEDDVYIKFEKKNRRLNSQKIDIFNFVYDDAFELAAKKANANIKTLLNAIRPFWSTASYARPQASSDKKKPRTKNFDNRPSPGFMEALEKAREPMNFHIPAPQQVFNPAPVVPQLHRILGVDRLTPSAPTFRPRNNGSLCSCGKKPAVKCPYHKCGGCCRGCVRHTRKF